MSVEFSFFADDVISVDLLQHARGLPSGVTMELEASGGGMSAAEEALLVKNLTKSQKCNRNAEVINAQGAGGGESSDSMEKCDVSPENSTKKDTPPEVASNGPSRMTTSASAILGVGGMQCGDKIPKSMSLFDVCPEQKMSCDRADQEVPESPKHAMAFTIDFGGGRTVDEQRYRSMYERFQNRHRRGVSLSKFEDTPPPRTKIPMSAKLPRKQIPPPAVAQDRTVVKLRDKSRLQAPSDSSKRHSWSPRSSTVVPDMKLPSPDVRTKFTPRSITLAKALEVTKLPEPEVICPAPPLEDLRPADDDQVSEAGTYTLDADTYTEEQKERMNIDRMLVELDTTEELKINEVPGVAEVKKPQRPTCFETNLETFDYDLSQRDADDGTFDAPKAENTKSGKRKNILEISCSHETSTAKPKVSYLERLKNRVRNISDRTFHKSRSPDKLLPSPDVGTFTSVTTSGILSVKPMLESNPRLTRRNSLTKSQIDNSEYVQGVSRLNLNSGEEKSVRSPKRGVVDASGGSAIKSAATKSDWIQEWARHARQHSAQMSRSYNFESPTVEEAQNQEGMSRSHYEGEAFVRAGVNRASIQRRFNEGYYGPFNEVSDRKRREILEGRPPLSPTKIPSPMGSLQRRPRSRSSSTRSNQGSQSDLTNDTEQYLQKTAAAITTLQKIHRDSLQNSPQRQSSPQSPKVVSPGDGRPSPTEEFLLMQLARMNKYHRRNLSLDGAEIPPTEHVRRHTRHHSYENNDDNLPPRPLRTLQSFIDGGRHVRDNGADYGQTPDLVVAKRHVDSIKQPSSAPVRTQCSPIRRSTSFSAKTPNHGTPKMLPKPTAKSHSIQKSASSTNFRTVIQTYGDDDIMEFYINDNVDLDPGQFSSGSDVSGEFSVEPQPISNTRPNKAFLMRMEQNRRPSTGGGGTTKPGVIACPNTPEMRRREPNVRTSFRERMSMPRDSSLTRMKQDLTRRQQTAKPETPKSQPLAKVQPKYLDISKYKPVTGANFLKKDESKSYLLPNREVKKSPSSASVNLSRTDAGRTSNRSIKSASIRPSSGKKEAPTTPKQSKETELAMWKRRASYDPMKAALEGKKKQDEARRLAQQSKLGESSSAVLRSQSFHSGVSSQLRGGGGGQLAKTTIDSQWQPLEMSDSSDDIET
ncbi:hypothetical protein DMENIID0001_069650 [Sergentomyia squamirostris]